MTVTTLDNDTDVTALFDWEFETPCEEIIEECGSAAEWSMRFPCCGALFLLCPKHYQAVLDFVDMLSTMRHMVHCNSCEKDTPAHSFRSGVIIDRIK